MSGLADMSKAVLVLIDTLLSWYAPLPIVVRFVLASIFGVAVVAAMFYGYHGLEHAIFRLHQHGHRARHWYKGTTPADQENHIRNVLRSQK